MHHSTKETTPEERVGTAAGMQASGIVYADNVVFTAAQGHGFAAEQVNHLHDKFTLRDAIHEGTNLKLNGADRIVDGVQIQTKYCESGSKSVAQCFDSQGRFAYWADDGRPMQIEVPPEQYDEAVQAMRARILKGQVAGVANPDEAFDIIKKGHYDYATARAIARAGTIEGLQFDAVNGIQVAGSAAGISAAISYALAIWRGDDHAAALEAACMAGLKVGGVAWLTSIATAQLGRTGLAQSMVPLSQAIAKRMGADVARQIAAVAGRDLSGAAATSFVAKLGRGNAIAAGVTTLVMSSAELFRLFEGRASFAQVFKTVAVNGASAAGGLSGAAAGATQGAAWGSAIPGPGTIIGGVIGGLVGAFAGSSVAESATKFVLDGLIEDDAVAMLAILQAVFAEQAQVHLLTQAEADGVLGTLEAADLPSTLRDMYGASDRPEHARSVLVPIMAAVAAARPHVTLPGADELVGAAERLLPDPAAGGSIEAPARVYNATGSLSVEARPGWTLGHPATNSDSFAAYLLPSNRASAVINVHDASSTATAALQAQALLDVFLKGDPARAWVGVESTVMGGRLASRFSVATAGAAGKVFWTTCYVVRVARYVVTLHVISRKRSLDADALEAISDWFATLQLHSVDATPQAGATSIVDDVSGFRMTVPPGWTGKASDDAGDPPRAHLFRLGAAFAEVEVYALNCSDAGAYREYLARFLLPITGKDPQARQSVREATVNGRPAAHGQVVSTVDGQAIQLVATTLQFDGVVVMLTGALGGPDAWEYVEQCETLAWRLGVAADASEDGRANTALPLAVATD